jgi:hypothetical protein
LLTLAILGLATVLGLALPAAVAQEPGGQHAARGGSLVSPGETSMFGVEAKGGKFVYVLDRSGSMGIDGGRPLAAVKAELLRSLEKLDTVHQFQIVFYNERPRVFNPTGTPGRLAFGTAQNKAEVRRFVESVTADGGTDHEEAVLTAVRMHPDVIFFLTDGDDPKLNARQLARIDRLGPGITIHTIEFGTGAKRDPGSFMVKLARQSGGRHVYIDVAKLPAPE